MKRDIIYALFNYLRNNTYSRAWGISHGNSECIYSRGGSFWVELSINDDDLRIMRYYAGGRELIVTTPLASPELLATLNEHCVKPMNALRSHAS